MKRHLQRELNDLGLDSVFEQFSLSPFQLYQNLASNQQLNSFPGSGLNMESLFQDLANKGTGLLDNPQKIRKVIVQFISQSYSLHPLLRRELLDIYRNHVQIDTNPTESGEHLKLMDVFYPAKRI